MVILPEQYGYKNQNDPVDFKDYQHLFSPDDSYSKIFTQARGNEGLCYELKIEGETPKFKTSYFVGVDWIIENQLPIYVKPKQNNDAFEVNYLLMFFESLEDSENLKHLEGLCQINFDKQPITINQKQDLLSPLLIVQFLKLLKNIVQKGLKKSYYPIESNLRSRIKGKVLLSPTIKHNHTKLRKERNFCRYDEFGVNNIENKILKKALVFAQRQIRGIKGVGIEKINHLFNFIRPAFDNVDESVTIYELKKYITNPIFKDYNQALKLAKLILRKYGYNIQNIGAEEIQTPPFWIDMSKLFELYIFKKLREIFPQRGEITYHKGFNYLEPDYILKSKDGRYKMIIDAKYKPQYEHSNISTKDIRQVSGYARLKSIYKFLDIEDYNTVIDCLIIYSNQDETSQNLSENSLTENHQNNYVGIFKRGIFLPQMS